ncbi:hypothetical protein DEO72_LG8g2484 [Vigna unguiculata]|uniref:Uncharacterized protein n=1 Tax=Vigna unguiculata TaxID=3917 RepID=A0A4D6MTM6_VIGUN|nr:hypothetical protein DEO72_LG8g2484 [Vigna unguiculata]
MEGCHVIIFISQNPNPNFLLSFHHHSSAIFLLAGEASHLFVLVGHRHLHCDHLLAQSAPPTATTTEPPRRSYGNHRNSVAHRSRIWNIYGSATIVFYLHSRSAQATTPENAAGANGHREIFTFSAPRASLPSRTTAP